MTDALDVEPRDTVPVPAGEAPMIIVYIAGPFRGPNTWAIECNVRRAEALALDVARAGMTPLCPHTNTRFFHGTCSDQFWLEATMALLRRSDAVMLTQDWHRSTGARDEVAEAQRLVIPVFAALDELVLWQQGCAARDVNGRDVLSLPPPSTKRGPRG